MKSRSGPSIDDRRAIEGLRKAFSDADYTSAGTKEALQAEGETFIPKPEQIPVLLQTLPDDDRLSTIIKLFTVGIAVGREQAQAALEPVAISRLASIGLVDIGDDHVAPLVTMVPFRDLLFAFDLTEGESDQVMGITPSSILLTNLTPREPVESTLDLGTGCGVHALLAARHSKSVVATDANPRALSFTRFNTLLNDLRNVEVRQGSWLEPVEGMSFDLIVSNPPFVVSPDFDFLFRDSDSRGDAVSRMLAEKTPAYLSAGGRAVFLMSWIVRIGETWAEPLARWVENKGCDAWFLHASSEDPFAYATGWNSHLRDDPIAYTTAFNRWIEFFRDERTESIGYGATVLKKHSGANWIRTDDLSGGPPEPAGNAVSQLLNVEDKLNSLDGEALLKERPRLTPKHRLEQVLRFENGNYVVQGAALQLEEGLFFRTEMDPFKAHLLSRLDGNRTLSEAIAEAQSLLAPQANEQAFLDAGVLIVEQMLRQGFLHFEN